jgi:mannose-6-phosphate isomerase-like protein (cupin superfamily)
MSVERAPIKVLLRGEQSWGVVSVIKSGSLPGFGGPPLHHYDFDETFYVVEGELTFRLGDEPFSKKAGEIAFAPRGVPHTYANPSDAPTRHLIICTPAASSATSPGWRLSAGGRSRPNGPCSRYPGPPPSVRASASAGTVGNDPRLR